MDGEDGKMHPLLSLYLLHQYFHLKPGWIEAGGVSLYDFILFHSKSMIEHINSLLSPRIVKGPSKLLLADKVGTYLYPSWLWALMAWFTGEGDEYAREHNNIRMERATSYRDCYRLHQEYREWVKKTWLWI